MKYFITTGSLFIVLLLTVGASPPATAPSPDVAAENYASKLDEMIPRDSRSGGMVDNHDLAKIEDFVRRAVSRGEDSATPAIRLALAGNVSTDAIWYDHFERGLIAGVEDWDHKKLERSQVARKVIVSIAEDGVQREVRVRAMVLLANIDDPRGLAGLRDEYGAVNTSTIVSHADFGNINVGAVLRSFDIIVPDEMSSYDNVLSYMGLPETDGRTVEQQMALAKTGTAFNNVLLGLRCLQEWDVLASLGDDPQKVSRLLHQFHGQLHAGVEGEAKAREETVSDTDFSSGPR